MRFLARIIEKRPGWIAGLGILLSMLGGYYSIQLYKNLRTDIEELLPTSSRSIKDLEEVTQRLEAFDNLVILVFSNHPAGSKRYVDALASELKKVPKNTIYSVEYRIDREIEFFKAHRSLFIEVDDLKRIRDYVRDRIDYEKELYNPLTIFSNQTLPEPVLDYLGMKKKYETQASGFERFPGGYYATPDEKLRLMVIYMPGKGLENQLRMKDAITKAVARIDPKAYAPDIQVKYTGNIQNVIEESSALVADLVLSTIVCVLLVMIAMIWFYRAVWATISLVASLFMGTAWTFGIAYYVVGYLNANTAFLASIVIGNGINFGIILLARYLEERRNGLKHDPALESAMVNSATSTLTAALAAGLAYGSLILTGFRGFNQFGIIGFCGMVLCWISSYTLMPAFLTLLDRWYGDRWVSLKQPKALLSGWVASAVDRFPGPIWLVSVAAIVGSLILAPGFRKGVIETDLSKLRDKESMAHGAGSLYHYIDDVFGHSVSPAVILPRAREEVPKVAKFLKAEKKKQTEEFISSIQTLDDFVPKDQAEKIQLLKEIGRELPPRLLRRLPASEQKMVRDLLDSTSSRPFTEKDLPPLVLDRFREKDGTIGRIVVYDKKITKDASDDVESLRKFVELGRRAADEYAAGAPVAGQLPISYDMFRAIETDGPRATLVAFLAVIFLVVVLFRNFKTIFQIIFALVLGVTWMAGIMLAFGLKINFLNFIALPITFGIGVDYGVNIFQRYREAGPGQIVNVVRYTGGAVMLASLTTIIGYSSLLIAGNQAFVSFGRLAVLGEFTCVTAAVVSLPAFLRLISKKRKMENPFSVAQPTEAD